LAAAIKKITEVYDAQGDLHKDPALKEFGKVVADFIQKRAP
jgi:hypothetical protein